MAKFVPALVALACAAAPAAAAPARRPVVPVRIQARIAKKVPALAYAPTRMAIGYRYRRWDGTRKAVHIHFRNRAGRDILFTARPQVGACRAGKEKSFQLAGNKVWWRETATGQEAWRCVRRGKRLVRQSAFTKTPPTKFAAVGLGAVVASGKKL